MPMPVPIADPALLDESIPEFADIVPDRGTMDGAKMPIYYGYYKWYGNRVERLDGSTVIYGGDPDFSCDEEWIIQTIYGEKTFERTKPFDPPDYLNSGGCFELRFNAGIDPSLVGLKSLGLNLLQLEGLIIN